MSIFEVLLFGARLTGLYVDFATLTIQVPFSGEADWAFRPSERELRATSVRVEKTIRRFSDIETPLFLSSFSFRSVLPETKPEVFR
jgi:hypothetical protein